MQKRTPSAQTIWMANVLGLCFLYLHQLYSYDSLQDAASAHASATFALTSSGHAQLLNRYNALARDRADKRIIRAWEPTACEREALAVLFDAQAQAIYDVPQPWLLKGFVHKNLVLSGAKLSPTCHFALNPAPMLPGTRPLTPAIPLPPLPPPKALRERPANMG